jgi:ribosomal protein S14
MFGKSHERVRQVLAQRDLSQITLLPETKVAAKLGYPLGWLVKLRKEGIINPIKRGFWLYSEEQVRRIPSLITETRKCEQCGRPRPFRSHGLCRECRQYRIREGIRACYKAKRERLKIAQEAYSLLAKE